MKSIIDAAETLLLLPEEINREQSQALSWGMKRGQWGVENSSNRQVMASLLSYMGVDL